MRPDQYENNAEGILCVYKNPKWLVCIKNWKPDNDIAGIAHLDLDIVILAESVLTDDQRNVCRIALNLIMLIYFNADEFVIIDQLVMSAEIFALAIVKLCGK